MFKKINPKSGPEVHDVIVIGARCAGSPLAMLLARKGYKVLLLDRSTFPSDILSGHYLHQLGAFPTNDGLVVAFVSWPNGEFQKFRAAEGGRRRPAGDLLA